MIDLEELERLAKAATPGPWEASDYGSYDGQSEAWYVDTTSKQADIYSDEGGIAANHWDADRGKHDMQFVAAANPATILALTAEVRRLRAALSTPIAMKMKWSPMSENMVDGFSQNLGEDVLNREPARAKAVTVYYGQKCIYTNMAAFCAAHPKEGV